MINLTTSALNYSHNGYYIIPLRPQGKEPLTQNGLKDASKDNQQIIEWWEKWPDANIGLITGKVNNLFVLDLDGEYPANLPDLDLKPSVKTDRGFHYYFDYPDNCEVKTRAKINGFDIDIRGEGGYIVAPPSIHPNGGQYEFITS